MRTFTAIRLAAGLLLGLALAQASAQQVLTTLPSNEAGGTILVNPITNKIYMVGSSSIDVFDGATNTKTTVAGENNQTTAAIDPITNKVYIGRGASPTAIIVLDGATRTTDLDPGGQSVGAMAINPVTHKLYVSRPGGNELTVIDTLNGNAITRVTIGLTNPQKIAVDAAANKVYVTSGTTPNIYVVDGANNLAATITLTGNLEAIAVNPVTGKVYVTKSNNDLVEVDGTSHVATTIAGNPTLSAPRTIAINPVTNKVYAFSFPALPSTVTVIDGATRAVETSVSVSANPNAMVVDPVANRLYVVNQGGSVDVIDCNTNTSTALTVAAEPGAQFFSVGVNPVTGRVYAGNQVHQSVWVIDRSTYNQTTALKSGAAAVNPITGKIYLTAPYGEPTSPANRTLTVVDAATGGVTAIDLGIFMTQMKAVAVDPVLNQVYVTNSGRLAIVNGAAETLVTTISFPGSDLQDLVVNPVTHKVYIANASGANDVKIVNGLTNTQITPVVTGGGSPRIALNAETNQVFAILDRPQHGVGNPRSQVAVIDGAADALLKVVELGTGHPPRAIAVNPVTNRIYVATDTSNPPVGGAFEIVGSTLGNPSPTVNTLQLGNHHGASIAVNPVTNTVWAGTLSGGIFMIDPVTATVTPVPGTDSSAVSHITVDTVRNKVYGTQYLDAHMIAVDGATFSARTIDISGNTGTGGPNFPGPGRAVVDHTTGKVWVPCDQIGCNNTVILDPAPGTFDKHQPGVTLVGGLGGATSAAAPSLSVATSGTYSPSDPAVQKLYFRQGDSQSSHSTASGLAPPYTAALSGLSKGLNYVSLFALDAMAGTSTSSETGASPASFGANPTMTGAPKVFAFVYTGPPEIVTASVPNGTQGVAYSQALKTFGGVGTITHSVTGPPLPTSLSISGGGTISGTNNTGGTFGFTVTATDSLGTTGTKAFSITIPYLVTPSAGSNGSISPNTVQAVSPGGQAIFTVTPNAGYTAAVGGTCGGNLAATTYTTNAVNANCTVSATFTLITYTVTSSAGSNGSITPSGGQTVNHGSQPTFTVTPSAGYTAVVGGTCGGSLNGAIYTTNAVTANCTVSATFTLNTYTVTSSAGSNGSITPSGGQTVNHGSQPTFTVTPSAGYTAVVGGTCGGNLVGGTYTTSAIIANCTVSATFTQVTYTVTPSAGSNGSISPNTAQTVGHGGTTAFTVTPSAGYTAVVGGTCGGNLAGATYTTNAITANCTVSATFTQNAAPALSLSATSLAFGGQSMGTTSPPMVVTVTNTGNATLTVASVSSDNARFVQTNNCASVAQAATCTINVTFSPVAAGGALNSTVLITGAVSITSNAAGSPHAVSLTGTAQKSFVSHYYRSILRRAADTGGFDHWQAEAARVAALGANVNEVWFALAQAFYFSGEYAALNRSNTGYITDLYTTFFNRAPDTAGLNFWVGNLDGGMPREVALAEFMLSAEFRNFSQAIFGSATVRAELNMVIDFYRGVLSRLPDDGGFNHWVGKFRTAQCQGQAAIISEVEAISSAFALSGEYAARNRTAAQYVGDLYNAFLRRGGDLSGVQYWIGQVSTSARTREQVRVEFKNSPEFQARVQAVIQQGCLPP